MCNAVVLLVAIVLGFADKNLENSDTMVSEVESIVRQIVKTSPPGDDRTIIGDVKALLNNADADKLIAGVLRENYTTELAQDGKKGGDAKLVRLSSGQHTIVSKYNLSGIKFFDIQQGIVFDYDFINGRVIDVEEKLPSGVDGKAVEKLQEQLDDYIAAHYNELSRGMVIPGANDSLTVVIVGEKLNDSNFYNGKWAAVYEWDEQSGRLSAVVKVRVHYYEDGNVVMNTAKEEDLGQISGVGAVIDKIAEYEKNYELSVLKKVNVLNEQKFKNLRRLMPISRSKIQWGRAIGNYKLGQDVAGGRH